MHLHLRLSRRVLLAASAALTALGVLLLSLVVSQSASAATAPGLGTASSFAVLGATQVTNAGITTVSGNLGVSPGTAVTGNPKVINGVIHSADDVALQAKTDAEGAYTTAMNEVSTPLASAELGGKIFAPGAYDAGTLGLTGTLVLDGLNDPSSVFIFKSAADLITSTNSEVLLVNGATACNVFWQVTSSATLGTNTVFAGTLLASTSVFVGFGSDIEGRLVANTGQVTLDTATVVLPRCGPGATTTVTAAGPTTTATETVAGPTTTVTGPTTTETTTAAGPTTTVTTGPVTTQTVTEAGSTTTVAGATVTVAGPTTTVAGPATTETITEAGPTTTATTTVAGPTTTVTTGPVTTETVTAPGATTTVTGPGATTTVTGPGATTTVAGAPAQTVTVTAGGAGTGGTGGASQLTETVTATVVLSVAANGETVAVQTLAASNGSTANSGLVFTGEGAGTGGGGLAFTGSADRIMAGTGVLLVALGGLALLLVRRAPSRHRQH